MSVRPPASSRRLFFLAFAVLGLLVLGPALVQAPRYKAWDFGPHHALTRALAQGLAAGHVPRYLVHVSTGDSPYELYPLPTYGLAAAAALLTGDEANAPGALLAVAVLCHVGIAALVARLASHFAPFPLAFCLGLAAFFDLGSFESGAAQTILEVGLLHGALAQCLLLAALDLVLVIARAGPRPARVVALWALAGLAAAAHPSSLLFLAALLLALVVTAAAATSLKPRNLVAAALHIALGVLLAAFVWAPYASRVLHYGLHFAYPAPPLSTALGEFVSLRQPPTSFPPLLALGYVALALAPLRRRGLALVVAALTATLLLAFTELPHRLYFDWLPRTLARLQSFRFLTLARPLLFVAAAIPLAWAWSWLRSRPALLGLAFPLGTLALGSAALLCAKGQSELFPAGRAELHAAITSEVEDPAGFEQLVTWAGAQQRQARPERFSRLMWAGAENGVYHLAAEAGLPAFFVGDGVGMLLRERIEDNSLASLRRFNVRWLAARLKPPERGDARSERRFGSYFVRELPEWEGGLARIEKGSGRVRVTSLQPDRLEVELLDTQAPALVALGLGYYPRWRAQLPDGTAIPVFAVKATPHGSVRVVAAWLPPGRTVFRADAPLPSDGLGLAPSMLGLSFAALTLAAGRSRRSRRPLLRALRPRRLRLAAAGIVLSLAAATLTLGVIGRPVDKALRLVSGWQPQAQVEARAAGAEWTACRFAWLRRDFECPGLGRIGDGVAFVLRDHPSSTPFLTPGIVARPEQNRVEYRIRLKRRLEGMHWAATWGPGGAILSCAGRAMALERRKQSLDVPAGPRATECELVLRTRGRAAQGLTLVRTDAVDLDRMRDVPWAPDVPPPLTPTPLPARGESRRR